MISNHCETHAHQRARQVCSSPFVIRFASLTHTGSAIDDCKYCIQFNTFANKHEAKRHELYANTPMHEPEQMLSTHCVHLILTYFVTQKPATNTKG